MDITEQRRTEAGLRQSQAQRSVALAQAETARDELYQFFMQAPEPMVRFSGPEHVFTLSNPANNQLIGFDPLNRKVREVFTEEEAGNFFKILDQVYQTGVPFNGKELPFKKPGKEGATELRWLNVGYYPARDENGKITGILGIAHDVTDQVIARKVIEENEGRVQRYAEAMPQLAFMTNAQGEVTYFNTQHYEYFGVDRIEKEGSRWKEQNIVHPDDLPMSINAWSESVRTGKTYQVQYRLKRRDGVYRWFLARGVPGKECRWQYPRLVWDQHRYP
jgi:PAS domain S-box-containing protein